MGPSPARIVGPAIASMLIYLLMAMVLFLARRPVSGQGRLTHGRAPPSAAGPRRCAAGTIGGTAGRCCCSGLRGGPARRFAAGEGYVLDLATRVMIFAIAAVALDLLVGYAGLVSFGHAAFVGIGAYATGFFRRTASPTPWSRSRSRSGPRCRSRS